MCLSVEGDLIAGVAIVAIGIDACLHLKGRDEYLFIAALPILLGLHQIIEAFVWWGLQGVVPERIGDIAMWIYLLIALVVLPIIIPALVLVLEPTPSRKRRIVPFVVLGVIVATFLLTTMLRNPPTAAIGEWHIAYGLSLGHGMIVAGVYFLATCGAMLVSGLRHIVWFGIANLVAVVVLARLTSTGFPSMWCFYAAAASAAIALYMRFGEPEVPVLAE